MAVTRNWRWLLALVVLGGVGALVLAFTTRGSAATDTRQFNLFANQRFVPCLAAPGKTPVVQASVRSEDEQDLLTLRLSGFKPGLRFDEFTVQNSPQRADGSPDPAFQNFGLAWYQSDIQVDFKGSALVTIRTILVNQIFGFDPAVNLPPTNTYHVGFWFNDPKDAAACGFTGTTPFNGEHRAGPLAFITRPNATTNLGPLCQTPGDTSPDIRSNPPGCKL